MGSISEMARREEECSEETLQLLLDIEDTICAGAPMTWASPEHFYAAAEWEKSLASFLPRIRKTIEEITKRDREI